MKSVLLARVDDYQDRDTLAVAVITADVSSFSRGYQRARQGILKRQGPGIDLALKSKVLSRGIINKERLKREARFSKAKRAEFDSLVDSTIVLSQHSDQVIRNKKCLIE